MAGTIKQQLQAKAPVQRITRTQRVAGQQEYARNVAVAQELQALKNKSDTIMQSSTPENYSEKYNQLDERIRQYYLSPNEYFTLPEVQKYQQEKKKYDDAIEDQKDYEMAQYYSNFAKMRKVSDFYMIVSFKEKATKRQLKYYNQIVAKDKALAEYYSPENVSKRKEVKLTPLNQAELIAVGQAMQLPTGKPVLVKNVNESDASYNYRLAQLGKSTAITQPVVTQEVVNKTRLREDAINIQNIPEGQYKDFLVKNYYETVPYKSNEQKINEILLKEYGLPESFPLPTAEELRTGKKAKGFKDLVINPRTNRLQEKWLVDFEQNLKYINKDLSGEYGLYRPTTNQIIIDDSFANPPDNVFLHEGFHKTGNRFLQLLGLYTRTGISEETIKQDFLKLSNNDTTTLLKISENYPKSQQKEELLARFSGLYPDEISNPTTETGKYVSEIFKKEYGLFNTPDKVIEKRRIVGINEQKINEILLKESGLPESVPLPTAEELSGRKISTEEAPKIKIPSFPLYFGLTGISPFKLTKYDFNITGFGKETIRRADIELENQKKKELERYMGVDLEVGSATLGQKMTYDVAEQKVTNDLQFALQKKFEEKYTKFIDSGLLTQEEAINKFESSKEYTDITMQYNEKWQQQQRDLYGKAPIERKIFATIKATPFELTKLAMYPTKGTTELAITGVAIGTLGGLGKLAPKLSSKLISGVEFGTFGYGTYKMLSPTSSFEESVSGGSMALLSGLIITSKYLPKGYDKLFGYTPVKKYDIINEEVTKIMSKKTVAETKPFLLKNKQTGEILGKSQITTVSKTFNLQLRAGERTEWFRNWKYFLNKRVGMSFKPAYYGVPNLVKPTTYDFAFFKYSPKAPETTISKYLASRGYSAKEIANLMKYTPSKFALSETSGYIITTTNLEGQSKAVSRITRTTYQPKLEVNKKLGIYTRPAPTLKETFTIEKEILKSSDKAVYIKEDIFRTASKVTSKSVRFLPNRKYLALTKVKTGELQKYTLKINIEQLTDKKYLDFLVKASKYRRYQSLSSRSFIVELKKPTDVNKILKIYKQKNNKLLFVKDEATLFKYTGKPKIITEKKLYLLEKPKAYIEPTKEKLWSEFSSEEKIARTKDIIKFYNKPIKAKIVNKPSNIKFSQEQADAFSKTIQNWKVTKADIVNKPSNIKFTQEQADAFSKTIQNWKAQQLATEQQITALKNPTRLPDIFKSRVEKVKNIFAPVIKQTSTAYSSLSSLLFRQQQKTDLKAKVKELDAFKFQTIQKNVFEEDFASKQDDAFKQGQAFKLQPASRNINKPILDIITIPKIVDIPKIPPAPRPPTIPTITFGFGFELPKGKQNLKDKLKKKNIESFALFPDFSARMIGLKPKEYNEKQLEKEAMGLQTGFEIRRGGIVRKGRGRPKKAESMLMKKMKVPKDMDYLKNTVKNALKVKW